jgi:hypothetical protein
MAAFHCPASNHTLQLPRVSHSIASLDTGHSLHIAITIIRCRIFAIVTDLTSTSTKASWSRPESELTGVQTSHRCRLTRVRRILEFAEREKEH